ncbi:hypothetical protein SDC9_208831 [bioreactor metagenome]|uniref:Uncharacterized protein n=1 Tax=bioreactor metagenome TaxID=1076179 RepID=A0A645JCP5_9ZZZZ
MGNPDCGRGFVDLLAARAGGTVGVNPEVVRVDDDAFVVIQHRGDVQRYKGSMPAPGRVIGRDPHQTVHAGLGFQVAVSVFAVHLERNRFDPGLLAVQLVQNAHAPALVLAVAGIHAVKHLDPVLRLGAARARVQRENGVLRIVRPF